MLLVVAQTHIDKAWKDGAHCLADACKLVEEITGDQLKMILSRGERTLVAMRENDKNVGWGCFRIDQLPNMRVLHITDLVAPHSHFEKFFDDVKQIAEQLGCSSVRCAAQPAQARLYRMKCGFQPVYEILEVKI